MTARLLAVFVLFSLLSLAFPSAAGRHITFLVPAFVVALIVYYGIQSVLEFQRGVRTVEGAASPKRGGRRDKKIWLRRFLSLAVGIPYLVLVAKALSLALEIRFGLMMLLVACGAALLIVVLAALAFDFTSHDLKIAQFSLVSLMLLSLGLAILLAPLGALLGKARAEEPGWDVGWQGCLLVAAFWFVFAAISVVILIYLADALLGIGVLAASYFRSSTSPPRREGANRR